MIAIKIGKTERYINECLETKGALLFTVIDPVDYKSKESAVKNGIALAEGGADAVVVGGSIGAQGELLDYVSKEIKEQISVPLILFPGNIATITRYADAIYFMSLLNARNPYWITQAQTLSAPLIKGMGVEPLPVGYIVTQPGGTVGWVGDANIVPREKPKIAAALALAGEYLGHRIIITDSGSNPKLMNFGPLPPSFVKEVKSAISCPYIVAGGVSTINELRSIYKSGADVIQIGTAFENSRDTYRKVHVMSETAKAEGRKKLKR